MVLLYISKKYIYCIFERFCTVYCFNANTSTLFQNPDCKNKYKYRSPELCSCIIYSWKKMVYMQRHELCRGNKTCTLFQQFLFKRKFSIRHIYTFMQKRNINNLRTVKNTFCIKSKESKKYKVIKFVSPTSRILVGKRSPRDVVCLGCALRQIREKETETVQAESLEPKFFLQISHMNKKRKRKRRMNQRSMRKINMRKRRISRRSMRKMSMINPFLFIKNKRLFISSEGFSTLEKTPLYVIREQCCPASWV